MERKGIATPSAVIAGLDPAIHEAARRIQPYVSPSVRRGIMDARVKPGHDIRVCGYRTESPGQRRYDAEKVEALTLMVRSAEGASRTMRPECFD
jgi:hypothetical protein